MGKIIGIDLGTSTSEAAVLQNGKPVLITNESGQFIIPSVVGVDKENNGEFLVGERALERALLYPEDTAIEIKRKIGESGDIPLAGKKYTAIELSAKILSYVKGYAEDYLQETVEQAVITVPAYFNNQQRSATMEAGRLAGLKVERIINEPTAAALCYGIEHMEEESYILVYDLGGGTFDVTLLEQFDGILEVKASSGNNKLGGKDFDQKIVDYIVDKVKSEHGVDLSGDIYARVKLKAEAVKCKIALSTQDSYEILLPMIAEKSGKPISVREIITRQDFEAMITDLVSLTYEPVKTVLRDGALEQSDLDIILLVGGSTKIPYVKSYVGGMLGQEPKELVNQDLAVALGAAVQAGIISEEIGNEEGIMLTDVAPYPLGIGVAKDVYGMLMTDVLDVIIPRNTTIPVSITKEYATFADYQYMAEVEVYQGDNRVASSNYFLGKFILGNIPRKKAGKEKIDVTFSYNLNGLLEVEGKVVSNGEKTSISLDMNHIVDVEDEEEVDVDVTLWKEFPMANKYKIIIRKSERIIKKLENAGESLLASDLSDALYDLKKAIVMKKSEEWLEESEEFLIDLLDAAEEVFLQEPK